MRLFRIYKCGFIAAFDQHALVNQEIQMRLYSRIYKYHLHVQLFVLAALVYAKSLKKILKFLKHRQSCVKATLMKSHGSANNGGGQQKQRRTGKQRRSKLKNPQEPTKAMKEY